MAVAIAVPVGVGMGVAVAVAVPVGVGVGVAVATAVAVGVGSMSAVVLEVMAAAAPGLYAKVAMVNSSVVEYVWLIEKSPVTAAEVVLLQSVPSPHIATTSAPVTGA